jgi:hypothetical protein
MGETDSRRKRAELTMRRFPLPDVIPNLANAPIEIPPHTFSTDCLPNRLFVRGQTPRDPGERARAHGVPIVTPKFVQDLEHGVRVAQRRQSPADRLKTLRAPS